MLELSHDLEQREEAMAEDYQKAEYRNKAVEDMRTKVREVDGQHQEELQAKLDPIQCLEERKVLAANNPMANNHNEADEDRWNTARWPRSIATRSPWPRSRPATV